MKTVECAARLSVVSPAGRLDMFLRSMGQETRAGGKGRSARRFGQAVDPLRPTHAHLLVQDERRQLVDSLELTGAAAKTAPAPSWTPVAGTRTCSGPIPASGATRRGSGAATRSCPSPTPTPSSIRASESRSTAAAATAPTATPSPARTTKPALTRRFTT